MAEEKTKVGWYIRNEKLERLNEIKRIKNNQLSIAGSPELKDVEIIEMAIDDLYFKVMSKSKDADANERISSMIDNNLDARLKNLESKLDVLNGTSLKHYKFFELFAVSVLKDIDGIAQKNSDLFGGNVEKTKEYFMNTFFPSILKNGSILSSIVDDYMAKLENGEIEPNEDTDEQEFDN